MLNESEDKFRPSGSTAATSFSLPRSLHLNHLPCETERLWLIGANLDW